MAVEDQQEGLLVVWLAVVETTEDLKTGGFDAAFAVVAVVEPADVLFGAEVLFLEPFFEHLEVLPHGGAIQSGFADC